MRGCARGLRVNQIRANEEIPVLTCSHCHRVHEIAPTVMFLTPKRMQAMCGRPRSKASGRPGRLLRLEGCKLIEQKELVFRCLAMQGLIPSRSE